MKTKLFIVNLVLLASCASEQNKTESKKMSTIVGDVIDIAKKRMYDLDIGLSHQTLVIRNPETATLSVDYIGVQPKRLEIKQFSEDSGMDVKKSFLFGEDGGFPVILTFNVGEDTSFQAITKEGDVISFLKNKEKVFMNELDSNTKKSKIYTLTFFLLDYISFFPNLQTVVIRPFRYPIPILVTSSDSVIIRSQPTDRSEKTVLLTTETPLLVLDYSINTPQEDSAHIWYKVSTENKKTIGWLKAHSQNVRHFYDGD